MTSESISTSDGHSPNVGRSDSGCTSVSNQQHKGKQHVEGEKIWCPDPRLVWQLGTIVEYTDQKLFVHTPEDDEEHEFETNNVHPFDPTHELDLENVSDMDNLHEAPLLDLLRRRYENSKIYTFTGDILISINPYKNIPMLYKFPNMNSISQQENPSPHVYVTADRAYRALQRTETSQSILISGESGAGKTEASKHIMRYLANISEAGKEIPSLDSLDPVDEAISSGSSVERCVLQSNPLLEAFGNAKTIRNDNSSRFGKFIKIHYDSIGLICGASTSHFLLEKSRIVGSAEDERNYHVFYQLCAGAEPEEASRLHLKPATEFWYLNQGNCAILKEINDKKGFTEVMEAMTVMGISESQQSDIWTLVASVLHLGNLKFSENGRNESTIDECEEIPILASLLGVTSSDVEYALCKRTMQVAHRGSVAEISLTSIEAAKSRNGLAKAIYSALFDWLVGQINTATKHMTQTGSPMSSSNDTSENSVPNSNNPNSSDSAFSSAGRFIGILDIFGFEILQTNSFEQLCINFANEMLQQQFNHHVFVYEQEVYVKEGIDWSALDFRDNQPCLDLIQQKPNGILVLLDEQAMIGRRASDANFIQKLHQTHGGSSKHPNYSKPRFSDNEFTVKHYAGEVTYGTIGFLDKNNDSLHKDLLDLMHRSTLSFLKILFPVKAASKSPSTGATSSQERTLPNARSRRGGRTTKMTGTMTVGRKFREQMNDLMVQLNTTNPSYVRCIKPNNLRFPSGWNAQLVLDQLIYLGVMETVRIRRSGFPVRRTFKEFYEKYEILVRKHAKKGEDTTLKSVLKDRCFQILKQMDQNSWQLGHKKVFLRDGQLRILDNTIRDLRRNSTVIIQKHFKRYSQLKKYQVTRKKIILLQAQLRGWSTKKRYESIRNGWIQFQALFRKFIIRRSFLMKRNAAVRIQSHARGHIARKLATYLRNSPGAATKIVSMCKMHLQRKRYLQRRKSCIILQAFFRSLVIRKEYLRKRIASSKISSTYKAFKYRNSYAKKKEAAILIHAAGRGFLARLKYGRKARERAAQRNAAQTHISRLVRGHLARRLRVKKLHYIIMIQARARANVVRTEYLRGREATIHSQAMIRRALARRKFLRERRMATRIESLGRMIIVRKFYRNTRDRIILIQRMVRGYICRNNFLHEKHRVVIVQSMIRRYHAIASYKQKRQAVIVLQAFERRNRDRRLFLSAKNAASKISATIKCKLQRNKYMWQRNSIVKIQAMQRQRMCRKKYYLAKLSILKIQAKFRNLLALKYVKFRKKCIIRLQLAVKSFILRIRLHANVRLMFQAANEYDLTTLHRLAQRMPGILRIRDRDHHMCNLTHVAAKRGDLNLARFILVNQGYADQVFTQDLLGNTPLHYACSLAHIDMVYLLAHVSNAVEVDKSDEDTRYMMEYPEVDPMSTPTRSSASISMSTSTTTLDDTRRRMTYAGSSPSTDLESPMHSDKSTPQRYRRSLVQTPTARPSIGGSSNCSYAMLKQGYLKKASKTRWPSRRYVVVDEVCLAIYKGPKDKIPLRMVELNGCILKRNSTIDFCFEIHSYKLKSTKNPEGFFMFVAETEVELQDWMQKIRSARGVDVSTTLSINPSMTRVDFATRFQMVNVKNKQLMTPLHFVVMNEDEGFGAVKVAAWLVEQGASPSARDIHGNTPLHFAVRAGREDLVETLLKKGADIRITNNNLESVLDLASDPLVVPLLVPGKVTITSPNRSPMLSSPIHIPKSTYLSVFIASLGVASSASLIDPHVKVSIMDPRYNLTEPYQETPNALIQDKDHLWYGNTWHIQTPMEHLCDGSVAIFELYRHDFKIGKPNVYCWTSIRLDLNRINSMDLTLEMYAAPVDPFSQNLIRLPGDSFLNVYLNVSS